MILALAAALLLVGQAAAEEAGRLAPRPAAPTFVTISQGATSGLDAPRRVVVRTPAQWAALWKEHAGTVEPAPARPKIDFKRQAVVVVALGQRPTAGWAVEITRIEQRGREVVVHVREVRPPSDAVTAQVLTQPYHMVRVRRPRGPVRFVDEAETAATAPLR